MANAAIEVTRERTAPPERVMTDVVDPPAVAVTEQTPGPSAEDALAQAHKVIEEKDRQILHTQQTADQERGARTRAEREAERLRQSNTSTQTAAVAQIVETTKGEVAAAKAALRAAKEAGDINAEVDAQAQLSAASTRLVNAEANLAFLKSQQPPEPTSGAGRTTEPAPRQDDAPRGPTAASQAWIDKHPRFKNDPQFRKMIIRKHEDLLDDGIQVDSNAYFRGLDDEVARLEGRQPNGGDMSDRGFSGAPPSGAQGGRGGGAGGKTYQTGLGPVTVHTKSDGSKTVSVPPHLRADFEEGAKICGMELGEYILDLAENGTDGLVGGDGQVFR